ncbi:cytochrome P450 [Russula brevipes]|nr:cytochrome P450 [Russula brevipes]
MTSFSTPLLDLLEAVKSSLLRLSQIHGILSIGTLLALIIFYAARYLTSPYRKLPPGPRGYPFIGNLLDLKGGQWLKFAEWQKTYGDLVYLNAAGQPIIILNSQRVAVDLFDRRAAIYSDRPRNIVACDIMTKGLMFGFAPVGDCWRRMRKVADEVLSKGSVKDFYETQLTEAVVLASDWLVKPEKWDRHLYRTTASAMLSALYGYSTVMSEKDHTIELINDFGKRILRASLPGAHLVELFPWMRHIPSSLAKWKRDAESWYKQDSAMFDGLIRTAETNIVWRISFMNLSIDIHTNYSALKKGDEHQSIGARLVHEAEKNKLSSSERSWLAGNLYLGGADTASSLMAWWVLAMLAYPETQARAQAELDAIVGRARPPTFADYPHLPYIRAMVMEALRWRTSVPMAVHRPTEDDWYEGMYIPKGTVCIANVWHMNHDPEIYGENAMDFDPARHLDANGDIPSGLSDNKEGHSSYGFGRRNCAGRHMANNSLFINIAILLWATKIERKKDASGQFVPLDVDGFVDRGIVVLPAPFECNITPRFAEAPAVLEQERELRGL